MSTIELIKATFKQPAKLIEAKNKKGSHVFFYMLFLSLILSLPVVIQSTRIISSIKQDGEEIVKKIPEFSTESGTLKTDKKDAGFIYQTNSIIFTFDPDGKRSKHDVEGDAIGGTMTVAFLKNEAVFILPGVGTTADVLESNSLAVPYSKPQMKGLNKGLIERVMTEKSNNTILFSVIVIVSAFMLFFNLFFDLIVLTLFASIFTRFRMPGLTYKHVFKIIVYCATLPTLFTSIVQSIWPTLSLGSIGLALTLIIYFNIFPKPQMKKKK